MTTARQLGNYERYSLARANIGHPIVVTFVATFSSSSSGSISEPVLLQAITTLLSKYPLLRSVVKDRYTKTPSYQVLPLSITAEEVEEGSISAIKVLRIEEEDPLSTLTTDQYLLRAQLKGESEFDLEKGPLWEVLWVKGEKERLILAVNHVVSDGSGTRNLFGELLGLVNSLVKGTNLATTQTIVNQVLPPSLESTIDLRPSYLFMIRTIFNVLVIPLLPLWLKPKEEVYYPFSSFASPSSSTTTTTPLYGTSTQIYSFTFPLSTVNALKEAGKLKGVKTLHPILNTCIVASLALAIQQSTPTTNKDELLITSVTPISLRSPTLNHPSATGNYISGLSSNFHIQPPPNNSFWTSTQTYSHQLSSISELETSKFEMGMLSFLSDSPTLPEEKETGWDKFLKEKKEGRSPFSKSFELSNLGVLREVGFGKEEVEVCWVQTASPIGCALCLNVCRFFFPSLLSHFFLSFFFCSV